MHVTEEQRQESIKKVVEEFIASEEGGEGSEVRTPSAPAPRSPLFSDPPRHAAPSAPSKDVESAADSLAAAAEIDVIESDIALLDENGKVVAEEIDVSVEVREKATATSDEKDEREEGGGSPVDGATPGKKAADAQGSPEPPGSDVEEAGSCPIDAEEKTGEKLQDGKRADEHGFSDGTPIDFELIAYSDLKGITYRSGGSAKNRRHRAKEGISSSELLRKIEELSGRNTVLLVATNDRSEYIADTTVTCGSFSKEGEGSPWDALALREFLAEARDSDSPSITAIYYTEKDDRSPIRYSCLSKRAKGKWVFDDHKWARRHLVDSLAAMGLWWIISSLKYKKKIC